MESSLRIDLEVRGVHQSSGLGNIGTNVAGKPPSFDRFSELPLAFRFVLLPLLGLTLHLLFCRLPSPLFLPRLPLALLLLGLTLRFVN